MALYVANAITDPVAHEAAGRPCTKTNCGSLRFFWSVVRGLGSYMAILFGARLVIKYMQSVQLQVAPGSHLVAVMSEMWSFLGVALGFLWFISLYMVPAYVLLVAALLVLDKLLPVGLFSETRFHTLLSQGRIVEVHEDLEDVFTVESLRLHLEGARRDILGGYFRTIQLSLLLAAELEVLQQSPDRSTAAVEELREDLRWIGVDIAFAEFGVQAPLRQDALHELLLGLEELLAMTDMFCPSLTPTTGLRYHGAMLDCLLFG